MGFSYCDGSALVNTEWLFREPSTSMWRWQSHPYDIRIKDEQRCHLRNVTSCTVRYTFVQLQYNVTTSDGNWQELILLWSAPLFFLSKIHRHCHLLISHQECPLPQPSDSQNLTLTPDQTENDKSRDTPRYEMKHKIKISKIRGSIWERTSFASLIYGYDTEMICNLLDENY